MGFYSEPCPSTFTGQHRVKSGHVDYQVLSLKIWRSVGAILYTSYLQILGTLYKPSSQSSKRVYPPPPIHKTFVAGFYAGAIQSVVAAPLDALSVRFKTSEVLSGRYKSMWQYSHGMLQVIGLRGM